MIQEGEGIRSQKHDLSTEVCQLADRVYVGPTATLNIAVNR